MGLVLALPKVTKILNAVDNAFNYALNTIQLTADSVLETLSTLDERPTAANIEFGIKFDAKIGAMVARNTSEAQLKVSLSWQKKDEAEEKEED